MPLVLKYLIVFAWSMAKFLLGPIFGEKMGLSFAESCTFTVLGGTATSVVIMLGGEKLRTYLTGGRPKSKKKDKKVFTKRSRMIVKVWRRYGIVGIAFLTPVLLSPIGGPIIATVLGAPSWKTIKLVFISSLFWGPVTTAAVYGLFDFVKNIL